VRFPRAENGGGENLMITLKTTRQQDRADRKETGGSAALGGQSQTGNSSGGTCGKGDIKEAYDVKSSSKSPCRGRKRTEFPNM